MERKEISVTVRMDAATAAKLDELRRKEPDLPGRPEMLRRLLERAKD